MAGFALLNAYLNICEGITSRKHEGELQIGGYTDEPDEPDEIGGIQFFVVCGLSFNLNGLA